MLLSFPETVWLRLIDYLGFPVLCKLREVNNPLRKKIDYDIFLIYKRFEGKLDTQLSEYLNYKIIYPELHLNKVDVPRLNFINIGVTFQMMRHFDILDIVDHYDMFKFIIHKAQINELNTTKLIRAIKLVLLGLSEHYTLECMPLTNERIEWEDFFNSVVNLNLKPEEPKHLICDGREVKCHITFKKKLIKFYIINPDFENFEEFRTLINSLTICDDYPNGLLEQED